MSPLDIGLTIAFGAFALGLALSALRLVRGPDATDRVLALDTLYVNAAALLVITGIALDTKVYFEVALVIALLGFVGTAVLAKFLHHADVTR